MQEVMFEIKSNEEIAESIFKMSMQGDASAIKAPGQFINIALPGLYLRRPISVYDYNSSSVTVIYKSVGKGTEKMSVLLKGDRLSVLTGLGNGFDTSKSGRYPLLIAGGLGTPPMYALLRQILSEGKKPSVILGFNSTKDSFLIDEFKAFGVDVFITTADGSLGLKGFVTNKMEKISGYTYFYACGPKPMLKAVCMLSSSDGEISMEERMGCGFGACMGCSIMTKSGAKRVCKEGPVFSKEEMIW
ncbi:MAG: dihydroorotate dehydrogenase electron transfer subunit [Lachnospiraceae bacterium]|nr:dihydroorotate dehydrogenase electron transfer subunit [Lachnospiraceae bacterium]